MSEPSTKNSVLKDDAEFVRPSLDILRIAPIRSQVDFLGSSRTDHNTLYTLPPLRTLEPEPFLQGAGKSSALGRFRESQQTSFSPDASALTRNPSGSSTGISHLPSLDVLGRSGAAGSLSSSSYSDTTSPQYANLDNRSPGQYYTYALPTEDGDPSLEQESRERPGTASTSYGSRRESYTTSRRSTAVFSDISTGVHDTLRSVYQSPVDTRQRSPTPAWSLHIRQQPRAARACGFGERDRRVIDPPPVIQLHSLDARGRPQDISDLRGVLSIVHASLWNEEGTADCTSLIQPGRRPGGRLMGTLVASATIALDERNEEGVFYAFPDLSCRSHGNYRLRFALMSIDPINAVSGSTTTVLTQVTSEVFTVYTAKDFPGMRPSTPLTQALKRQGMAIPVKKGKQTKGDRDDNDDDDDDD